MKKLLLTAAAVFAFGFANAQEVKFGVKAGLNMTTITGGEFSGGTKAGFHIGGLAEIKLTDKFAIQPELLFSTKGSSYAFFGIDVDQNLSYVDMPVMAKYFVIEGLSIEAGPNVGFLVAAELKGDGEDVDNKDDLKSVDFGLNFGAGYELKNGLMFQARYNIGLADISEEEDGDPYTFDEKNAGFSLSVGYKF